MKDIRNYDLTPHNTFGIKASCSRFVEFGSVDELRDVIAGLTKADDPLLVLGGGSGSRFPRAGDSLHRRRYRGRDGGNFSGRGLSLLRGKLFLFGRGDFFRLPFRIVKRPSDQNRKADDNNNNRFFIEFHDQHPFIPEPSFELLPGFRFSGRNRIITAAAERIAPEDPPDCQQ